MSGGTDIDDAFFPHANHIYPCFACGAVHMDLIDAAGAVGARAIFAIDEIDRTVAALQRAKLALERQRGLDTIGACEGEA